MEEQHRSSSSHGDDIEVLDSSDNKRDEAAARVQGAVIELENLLLPPIITTIQDLKDMPKIWYKIHVLIFDLRNYQANTKSRDRLKTVIDPSYIGLPYFSCTEAALMKSLQVGDTNGSATRGRRAESGDYRVCAAHDIAPILERLFGVKEKDLMRDKEFLGLVENWGVELGGGVVWKGL
ncbi:hypothetical protein N431DRAFT_491285 [Stipitochalara longipes BDJ]|nr:hypothetical protein N431DRAFT_491285 [Stipitochalara longipes BDJ]